MADGISSSICEVVDTANLIHHAHPLSSWRSAATPVLLKLQSYFHTLNANSFLYEKLSSVDTYVPPLSIMRCVMCVHCVERAGRSSQTKNDISFKISLPSLNSTVACIYRQSNLSLATRTRMHVSVCIAQCAGNAKSRAVTELLLLKSKRNWLAWFTMTTR